MNLRWIYFLLLSGFIFAPQARALTPMENLLLGDLSEYYSQEKQDPLNSIFQSNEENILSSEDEKLIQSRNHLAFYRGMINEGANLLNYCPRSKPVEYATSYDRTQALRSVYAHLQYRGLDFAIRALAKYAESFNYSKDDYKNLVDTMVGNSCSENLSIISLKQLKNNMMARFEDNSFELPSINGHSFFPPLLESMSPKDEALKREMQSTLSLFQSFCSWGGLSDRPRLLTLLTRHPVVMAYLTLDMSAQSFQWDRRIQEVRKVEREDQSAIACRNLVCRKVERQEFNKLMPRMVGSSSLQDDLRRMYCEEFKDAELVVHEDESPQVAQMMEQMKKREAPLLPSQFLALISGVPDFLVRSQKFDEVLQIAETSVDKRWNDWAQNETDNYERDLYYEEPLTLELVDRELYWRSDKEKVHVVIDVNLGEYDRVNQMLGKIKASFHVNISKSFAKWAQSEWSADGSDLKERRERVETRLQKVIKDDVAKAREDFLVPPWSGSLENLISIEVLEQLELLPRHFVTSTEKGFIQVPVDLYFAPFALKYQRYRYLVQKNKLKAQERKQNRELRFEQELLSRSDEEKSSSANTDQDLAKAPKN